MYKSYLLRLWRDDAPEAVWRASMQSIADPTEQRHFADLDSLVAFLLTHVTGTGRLPPPEEDHC